MTPRGRVLVVGGDQALINDLTPALVAREFELSSCADAKTAALRLSGETFSAVAVDAARVPAADLQQLAKLHKDRGGFALFAIEAPTTLSPNQAAPLRRLPWPLPAGFLDQVRAAGAPIVFLLDPTLFITQGLQNVMRQAGVQFFPMESAMGIGEMMLDQMKKEDEYRTKSKPPRTVGIWERLSGAAREEADDLPTVLGHVAVVKFPGSWSEAAQTDLKVRQAVPGAVCYLVTTADPVRAAVAAVKAGLPAVLPRDAAARLAEVLTDALDAARAAPREKERILLVDNDLPTLSRLSEALLALGYEVATTSDGDEAVRLNQRKPFHLAAIGGSALETTKMAGAKLALKLRDLDKEMRLVLMVDQFPVQDALKGVSRAVELGLDDAILKPIDASRLVLSIQRALQARFLLLENDRLRREAEDSARKLAQVNGFQTKFFATVAHDVKNPLTAIMGYSEVLGMRLKERPDELKCVSHIHSAAKTLNLLVSDLVDLAAIESGKLRVEIGEMDLAQVINEVKSRVDVVAQRKQLQFTTSIAPGLPAMKGDAHRVGQVIQNLCTNAVQYTKEGGKVTIEASRQGDWIVVGVRDTGIGISKEDLPRVWERFFQTKEAQNMRKAGFGLGLKIAREIVQMHGGDMGIESELGVGSFFFFKLPVPRADGSVPAPGASAAAAPAPPAPPAFTGPAAVHVLPPEPTPRPAPPTSPPAPPKP
ncbi:MAG: ATP-binding protein [Elusimicrobiota bacterium]|nr:ATP-binding protein [Elusimicrobiota bacterium]